MFFTTRLPLRLLAAAAQHHLTDDEPLSWAQLARCVLLVVIEHALTGQPQQPPEERNFDPQQPRPM